MVLFHTAVELKAVDIFPVAAALTEGLHIIQIQASTAYGSYIVDIIMSVQRSFYYFFEPHRLQLPQDYTHPKITKY